jgi:8-oxo-dGTP pyrophosphatase MutT (NUDIX family)
VGSQYRRLVSGRLLESSTVNAVGVLFYSGSTRRYLYLLRNDVKHPSTWALPGGKVETGESLMACVTRECNEELGAMPKFDRMIPLEKFTSADRAFIYHTFWCDVPNEFIPQLNEEHMGYAWVDAGTWPRPMHPGLWNTVNIESVQDKLAVVENSQNLYA